MPLIQRSGSLTSSLYPQGEKPLTPISDPADVLDQLHYVQDTMVNKSTLTVDDYPGTYGGLIGYTDGVRINVLYFHQLPGTMGERTQNIDLINVRHTAHMSLVQIRDFEITLKSALNYTYDPDKTEGAVQGEALIYPGLNPSMGDIFITDIGDGTYGEFRVTSVEALSYRQQSLHTIKFSLVQYATDEHLEVLNTASTRVVYFDKNTFLTEETGLLDEDAYLTVKYLDTKRRELISAYYTTFYDAQLHSFAIGQLPYDPYLTKFMNRKVGYADVKKRAHQLVPVDEMSFRRTVWGYLLEPAALPWSSLYGRQSIHYDAHTYADVGITALLNRTYVFVGSSDDRVNTTPYIFSDAFYDGDVTKMASAQEVVVHDYIVTGTVASLAQIKSFLDTYATVGTTSLFYYIPIYIHLIDQIRRQLTVTSAPRKL